MECPNELSIATLGRGKLFFCLPASLPPLSRFDIDDNIREVNGRKPGADVYQTQGFNKVFFYFILMLRSNIDSRKR